MLFRSATHHHACTATVGVGAGLRVAVLATVQCPDVGELPPTHQVVDAHLVRLCRIRPQAHRHVLEVRLVGRRTGGEEGTLIIDFDGAVADVFGFNALQLGLPQYDFLRANRIPLHCRVAPPGDVELRRTAAKRVMVLLLTCISIGCAWWGWVFVVAIRNL